MWSSNGDSLGQKVCCWNYSIISFCGFLCFGVCLFFFGVGVVLCVCFFFVVLSVSYPLISMRALV